MASFKEYLNQLCFDCISRLLLRKFWVKAQKHDKMDGAEKFLSISQCQTTVVYSVTVLSAWSGSFPEQTWLKKCRLDQTITNANTSCKRLITAFDLN
jgi:hypothetical protein